MDYIVSIEAQKDLENIWFYTAEKWSIEQADRYINFILDEIEYLALYPSSGRDFSKIKEGYFRTEVKSHLIFYKINQTQNRVETIRVLHERMDVPNRLIK